MDISTEIAAIQAASQGSELRQPLVGALNKLNSGSLPAVTSSDAGKILKVGANGWEVGEKSGYMPVPTDTMQITDNGTYDVTDYASANVHISGGGSAVLVPKTITQNGTYDPANDNADGYSEVIVNVAPNTLNAAVFSPDYKYTLQSSGDPVFSQRNGEMCLTRQGSARAAYVFSKIPSFAKKLCIAIEIVDYSSQYWHGAQVGRKANNTLPASGGWDATRLAFFTNSDATAESINKQSGVTINSTSNVNLSKQTVEIDISDINEDFYPFIQTQNQVMYLYSIYYTV